MLYGDGAVGPCTLKGILLCEMAVGGVSGVLSSLQGFLSSSECFNCVVLVCSYTLKQNRTTETNFWIAFHIAEGHLNWPG